MLWSRRSSLSFEHVAVCLTVCSPFLQPDNPHPSAQTHLRLKFQPVAAGNARCCRQTQTAKKQQEAGAKYGDTTDTVSLPETSPGTALRCRASESQTYLLPPLLLVFT